ncbi:MAG: glycosyltransferase family 2 protein [Actinomycetota bacterium]|jgi:glycosyltransferase involved in cell wall biosynthesis|nr:glycosyltransferase family 2 protein [Actinomycetota bacterium]
MGVSELIPVAKGPRDRFERRYREMKRLGTDLARQDFESRYPDVAFPPVLVLVASFLEADNIGAVLAAVPAEVDGLRTSTLVVIDGGDDGTEDICSEHGALFAKLPVNLGHGVALRLGYELAISKGAKYVVTLDADGQNDPQEIPSLLAPVVADEADFVIASRRLGVDNTGERAGDQLRKTGVLVFAAVINRLTHQKLTDTSNGFRALRIDVLKDVLLEQDQYQTAELIISAASRGWRIAERPTVWHPRASGESKKGSNLLYGPRYASVIARTWLRERR